MENSRDPDVEPTEYTMFGDGLLQMRYAHWLKANKPFVWPGTDRLGREIIKLESRGIPEFMKLIPKRGTCIQAGGNVGVYPRALAGYFEHVITFEPDKANYECLVKNVAEQSNVRTIRAALGDNPGFVSTSSHEDGNSGAVHVIKGRDVPLHMIDHYARLGCDLIWLDIEGYEELALKGAAQTIEKFKPAIIIEEQEQLAEMHGLEPFGAVKWLKERGYRKVMRHNHDSLYVYGGE
jgi:FkbM family methyltransferase